MDIKVLKEYLYICKYKNIIPTFVELRKFNTWLKGMKNIMLWKFDYTKLYDEV